MFSIYDVVFSAYRLYKRDKHHLGETFSGVLGERKYSIVVEREYPEISPKIVSANVIISCKNTTIYYSIIDDVPWIYVLENGVTLHVANNKSGNYSLPVEFAFSN